MKTDAGAIPGSSTKFIQPDDVFWYCFVTKYKKKYDESMPKG